MSTQWPRVSYVNWKVIVHIQIGADMERKSKHEEQMGYSSKSLLRSSCLVLGVTILASSASMAAAGAETPPNALTMFQVISAILSSSVITAFVTYLLSRQKTAAEVEKLRAETAKIKLEMQNFIRGRPRSEILLGANPHRWNQRTRWLFRARARGSVLAGTGGSIETHQSERHG